jgi:hypothetical protein
MWPSAVAGISGGVLKQTSILKVIFARWSVRDSQGKSQVRRHWITLGVNKLGSVHWTFSGWQKEKSRKTNLDKYHEYGRKIVILIGTALDEWRARLSFFTHC